MATDEKTYAVLTGDIVGSSRFDPRDLKSVMQRLRQAAEDFGDAFPGTVCGKLDVFSGDGWQVLLADWRRAIRAAVLLRAVVKADARLKADTRVAIGLGAVDRATLKLRRISESTGEAFARSGRALQEIKKPFMMAWAVSERDAPQADLAVRLLVGSLRLLDEVVSGWKPGQARLVTLALLGKQQEQIARQHRVSQPLVSKSLSGAGWRGIDAFLNGVEI